MPLTFCSKGESYNIKTVGGSPAVKQHLNELGLNIGTSITVVSELCGNLIVRVRNTSLALDKAMATKITV